MTAKRRRYLSGLLAPRRQRTVVFYGLEPLVQHRGKGWETENPAIVLDTTRPEVWEGSPADSTRSVLPTGNPGCQRSKSPVIQKCLILIERGLRGIPLEEVPAVLFEGLDSDLAELVESAGLSERESHVLALTENGWKQQEIAGWLEIDQATVSRRLSSCRRKLIPRLPQGVAYRFAVA